MYAKIENNVVVQYPYTLADARRDNPNATISERLSPELLGYLNMVPVVMTGAAYDPAAQVAEQNGCVYNPDRQRWETTWLVRDKTSEELNQDYEAKATQVRQERNAKLSACDWTQVLDAPVDRAAWATYRQALRDLTDQEGFPFNVVWPQEP